MSEPAPGRRPAGPRVTRRMVQVVLGLIWLLDGALQFQPYMFTRAFLTEVIEPSAQGQPAVVGGPMMFAVHAIQPHLVAANAAFATIQVLIGLGLIVSRRTVRPALAASFVWALFVWWFGEGFGMLTMGMASPLTGAPGAVVVYLLIGLLVWPSARPERVSAASGGALGDTGGRIVWAVLWLVLAALLLLPDNLGANALSQTLLGASTTGPGPLSGLDTVLAHATAGQGVWIELLLALVMAIVGIGVLVDRGRNALLGAGAALALLIWVTTESVGELLTGTATDPNTGPLVALMALALVRHRPTAPVAAVAQAAIRPEPQC